MNPAAEIGFVGLGVMGESMCRNLALNSGRAVIAYDLNPAPLGRLGADGVTAATSLKAIDYAFALAGQSGIEPRGARLVRDTLQRSSAAGQGGVYFPALLRLIAGDA